MYQKLPHNLPKDIKHALDSNKDILNIWETLTPLAKNEWICWITSPKRPETRKEHLKRFCEDLKAGKRRPCCWAGCPHRKKG
jgi:uncharacterized protein YdeI (YjbR/CyaY-like superfamily)